MFKRQLSTREIRLKLLRSGLHPHPGPPGDIDDPEACGDFENDAEEDYLRQAQADQRQIIEKELDGIHAVMTNYADELGEGANEQEAPEEAEATRELGEELRQLIATNRAAAIARKMKLAEAAAAAAKAKAEHLKLAG